jgi:hypothetical protein
MIEAQLLPVLLERFQVGELGVHGLAPHRGRLGSVTLATKKRDGAVNSLLPRDVRGVRADLLGLALRHGALTWRALWLSRRGARRRTRSASSSGS